MKERPIPFNAPMVRAILEGRKTQTRRAVKPVGNDGGFVLLDHGNGRWPYRSDDGDSATHTVKRGGKLYLDETPHACPYGQPGDRMWVRETFSGPFDMHDTPPREWPEWCADAASELWFWADGSPSVGDYTKPKPSIHMPRWASRITLEITGVRVERLQDISEADAIAEGVEPLQGHTGRFWSKHRPGLNFPGERAAYQDLWESINGPGSWDANPWVWVIEFKRVEAAR